MLGLLKLLLQLAFTVMSYVQQRQLLEAGQAQLIARNIDASLNLLGVMDAARDDALARFDAAGGVPDEDDPNLRD